MRNIHHRLIVWLFFGIFFFILFLWYGLSFQLLLILKTKKKKWLTYVWMMDPMVKCYSILHFISSRISGKWELKWREHDILLSKVSFILYNLFGGNYLFPKFIQFYQFAENKLTRNFTDSNVILSVRKLPCKAKNYYNAIVLSIVVAKNSTVHKISVIFSDLFHSFVLWFSKQKWSEKKNWKCDLVESSKGIIPFQCNRFCFSSLKTVPSLFFQLVHHDKPAHKPTFRTEPQEHIGIMTWK